VKREIFVSQYNSWKNLRAMKQRLKLIVIGFLLLFGCNSQHDNKFIGKYPDSEKYIRFLKEFERQLLEKEENGFF